MHKRELVFCVGYFCCCLAGSGAIDKFGTDHKPCRMRRAESNNESEQKLSDFEIKFIDANEIIIICVCVAMQNVISS